MQPSRLSTELNLPEYKRFVVMEAVARAVRTSLDPMHLCEAAISAIRANVDTLCVSVHWADSNRRTLRLVHISPALSEKHALHSAQQIPYDSSLPAAEAYRMRDPIVIENLELVRDRSSLEELYALARGEARGYICVPLWFGERFEGTLSALFNAPIEASGSEVQVMIGCSFHLAAALAQAHLHREGEQERARLRTVLDQVPEGVILAESSTGNITYANAMAGHILGLPQSAVIGKPFHFFQHMERREAHGRTIRSWNYALTRALCGASVNGEETIVTRPDGDQRFILCSSTPVRRSDGDILEAIVIFQDISARVSVELQKNAFVSMASHELRTPITAVQGFAEILLGQAEAGKSLDNQGSRHALEHIVRQSENLTFLVEEMLDLSRIEHAHLSLNRAAHNLIETITSVVEAQASTALQHHIRFVREGWGDHLEGWFDRQRISQVIANLLGNAIKYSPSGGDVEIGLRWTGERPDEVIVWVKDSGIGIAPTDIPHIFERFQRAGGLDPSLSGLGIGLYLVQDLVTRHGGRIWVESTEGVGSTFFFMLPMVDHRAEERGERDKS